MTPGTVASDSLETSPERQREDLIDHARAEPTATTVSRAVRPPVTVTHKRLSSNGFGEAYLVWRCLDCGLVGSLAALPERCLCGARREALSYVIED